MLAIGKDQIDAVLTWPSLVEALDAGHRLGRGQTEDLLLEQGRDVLLNRAAWKPGYGIGLKTVSCFFGNPAHTPARAEALAAELRAEAVAAESVSALATAVAQAEIVSVATRSSR